MRSLPTKLSIACVNVAMMGDSKPALLRLATNGDSTSVRAIFSDRYAPVADEVIFELIDEALNAAGLRDDARVRAVGTGPSTVLRVTVPTGGIAMRAGDVIEAGFDLRSSCLGYASISLTPTTYRLVCSNGMRAWRSEATKRMRHIGDPRRLREAVREAIPLAIAESRGDLDRWKRSVDRMIDNAFDEIEALRSFGASTTDVQAVARTLAAEFGMPGPDALRRPLPLYDVANAVTATARDRPVAARLELEAIAHDFLVSRTR